MNENWTAVFDRQEEGDGCLEISRHFARFMLELAGDEERCPELFLAAGLVSRYTEEGNVCLDLPLIAGRPIAEVLDNGTEDAAVEEHCPELPHWISSLRRISVVGQPGEFKPLILDERGRLYLYRYWEYEKTVADSLTERAARLCPDLDEALLEDGIRRLFPDLPDENEPDWQKIAALTAVRRMFCVISGGPGAGKTSTVVKVLALLLEQAKGKALRIAMAAPTGKAAARLKESIRQTKGNLACSPEIRSLIPDEVSTIHRLLATLRPSSSFPVREENVLPFDVVVIDEASMVDLPLMARLIRVVPQSSRMIILGDKDQLASVEAGAVLGDICGTSRGRMPMVIPPYPAHIPSQEESRGGCGGLEDSLVLLRKSYRFGSNSGIGMVSRSVNEGAGESALSLLRGIKGLKGLKRPIGGDGDAGADVDVGGSGDIDAGSSGGAEGARSAGIHGAGIHGAEGNEYNEYRDISWRRCPAPAAMPEAIAGRITQEYADYLTLDDPQEVFRSFNRFRILCALRHGPYGADRVNILIQEALHRAGLIQIRGSLNPSVSIRGRYYRGQPVMITRNDYRIGLFNGDVGLILPDPSAGGALSAYFPTSDGDMRKIPPIRLPEHESVYAMTVHKSQGSEFDRVLLLLPDMDAEILTRELIYTSITRARDYVEVWGREEVFLKAISRRIQRQSGLQDALWGG